MHESEENFDKPTRDTQERHMIPILEYIPCDRHADSAHSVTMILECLHKIIPYKSCTLVPFPRRHHRLLLLRRLDNDSGHYVVEHST